MLIFGMGAVYALIYLSSLIFNHLVIYARQLYALDFISMEFLTHTEKVYIRNAKTYFGNLD